MAYKASRGRIYSSDATDAPTCSPSPNPLPGLLTPVIRPCRMGGGEGGDRKPLINPFSAWQRTLLTSSLANRPEKLVALVAHSTNQRGISEARLLHINSEGIHISYTLYGTQDPRTLCIPFDPPPSKYSEARKRIETMTLEAESATGMVKYPSIDRFSFPWTRLFRWQTLMHLAMVASIFFPLRFALRADPNISHSLRMFVQYAVVAHLAESFYMLYLCRRHHCGITVGWSWCLSTMVFGYTSLLHFRDLVQAARINSVTGQS